MDRPRPTSSHSHETEIPKTELYEMMVTSFLYHPIHFAFLVPLASIEW